MGRVLPDTAQAQVNFYIDHINPWNDNAATIGLTPEAIAAFLTTKINPASEALEAARQAREASKNATAIARAAVEAMNAEGRGLIATIQSTAKNADDPSTVYTAAQIPAPDPRSPVGPPPQPESVAAAPQQDGSVRVTWKKGVTGRGGYQIERQVTPVDSPPTGEWTLAGTPFEREFVDLNIPQGTVAVLYRVRGVNTAGEGAWSGTAGCNLNRQPSVPALTLRTTVGRIAA